MATVGTQVTVSNSATALEGAITADAVALLVRNRGTVAVYLGGPAVATNSGYQLDPGESVAIEARQNPLGLYGITASSTAVCHVLRIGD